MARKSIETTTKPRIVIDEIGSDLSVKGWDRPEVLVKSGSDNGVLLEEREGAIFVNCTSDCVMYVPYNARLEVGTVGTNARFKALGGEIVIGQIGSDLALRDVGPTKIEEIGTDLSAKRIRGDLKAKSVGGNAIVRDVDGQFGADTIGGELHLRDVSGGVTADVGGNASLDFSPVPWQVYEVSAGRNLSCRVPDDANVDFEIVNGAQEIVIKSATGVQRIKEGEYAFKLGEGGVRVRLTAGDRVELRILASDWDSIGQMEVDFGTELGAMADEITEQATSQLEAQIEMLTAQIESHFSGLSGSIQGAGLSEEGSQMLRERLELAKERAAERAEAAADRARARLELKIAAGQRKADRKARASAARAARKSRPGGERSFTFTVPPPPRPADPVSEGERLMILQMLQEKKINVEQAEKLLAALEGKGS